MSFDTSLQQPTQIDAARILVVDKAPAAAKTVAKHLRALGYSNVFIATEGLQEHVQHLEEEIRRQSEELCTARHEAQLRYLSGKAEIATDVLHNVGNALNSVNVGVSLVGYALRESKLSSLERAAKLLQQHSDNPAKFLSKDERGRVLPSYLVELSETLAQERRSVLDEIDLLVKHLRHINAVVATQQKYATLCNVMEAVSLAELLSDAEELFGDTFARHGVKITRRFDEVAPVKTDRLKLMQVLLNVFKNAIQAIQQSANSGRGEVEIRLKQPGEDHLIIEFRDNGIGISPEYILKIFSHGFTTRKDGHGFGLHSCANIMKELGGSIGAASDGMGKGATFALQLPLVRG